MVTIKNDTDLILALKQPETLEKAFEQVVRLYQQKVYYHIRRMVIDHDLANDLTQDTFIKVYRSIPSFREDARLYTWIYRIATNECLQYLRKRRNVFFLPIHDITSELTHHLTQQEGPDGDTIMRTLQKALLTLPDKQRLVFNMRYFDELPYEEIHQITGTSVGALKASYHHAVKKVEDFINHPLNQTTE
jgi:RNA polymerase sigma factor (sigma-70 family)